MHSFLARLRPVALTLICGLGAAGLHAANPTANAGGPYTVTVNGAVVLNGAASNSPTPGVTIASYGWDINGHGTFTDLTGANPSLSLAAFPFAAGTYTIALKVTDTLGATSTAATASLTVTASPHFAVFAPFGGREDVAFSPRSGMIQASDGKFYGTTCVGGTIGNGSVYRINFDGTGFAVLHSFAGTDGQYPIAALVQGSDGRLYGTTEQGGANGSGTIFALATDGTGFTVLRSLNPGSDGTSPQARLIQGSDHRLYGTAYGGGTNNNGTIFALATDGTGFTVLRALTSASDGAIPYTGLTQGSDGRLYGTSIQGGANGAGTIFALGTDGTGFTVLRALTSASDGGSIQAGLIQGSDSRLYGTANNGGAHNFGTIFALGTDGTGFTVLHAFTNASDGGSPQAGLIQGSDSRLYGTAINGDTIFALGTDGTGFTVLHVLNDTSDGGDPLGSLIQGSDGRLYGTAEQGGANGGGTIFALATDGTGFAVLRSFYSSPSDGGIPYGSLIQGSDGRLYGTTEAGGANNAGTIFAINADCSAYTILHSFTSASDGENPVCSLIQGSDGRLYGTTYGGGANNAGTIFALATDGTGFTVLRSLASGPDGGDPYGRLLQGSDGRLYGTTISGGPNNGGTIFALATDGTGFTVLRSLTSASDGGNPVAGLIQGSDHRLYGTAQVGGTHNNGTIFGLATDGTGFTVLHALTSASDGGDPVAGLIQGSDHRLYGTTVQGGANSSGTIFALATDGTGFTVLRSLASGPDGGDPYGRLLQGSDGRLYGTTISGGPNNGGTIFALATDGTGFTVLRSLTSASDGGNPVAGLIQGSNGRLYGVAQSYGPNNYGTIFVYYNTPPVASFTAAPNPATIGATVTFNGSGSSDADGDSLTTYAWNFGDGNTSSGASATTTHTYASAGTFTASLQVTDSLAAVSTTDPITVTVNQLSQTITFGSLSGKTYGAAPFAVSATASSGLTPTFSITSGPATISGSTVTLTGAGTVTVEANQAGNATYSAATAVDQSFTVAKATATVSLGSLSPTYDGTAKSATSTTTPSGLTVNYTYNGSSTAPTAAGSYTVVGTISDSNYQGTASGTLVIGKASQTVSFGALSGQSYGTAPFTVSASASSGLTPTYSIVSGPATIAGNTVTLTGVGTVTVAASQSGNANYSAATPMNQSFTVSQGTATVILSNLSQTVNGTPKPVTVTTIPSGLATSVTYNGSGTAPSATGSYSVVATVTDANYTGTASGTLTLATSAATVTLGNLSATYDGTPKSATAVTAPSGLTVNLTYNGSSTAPTAAGSYTVVGTISDVTYAGSASGTLVIAKAAATVSLSNLSQTVTGSPLPVNVTTTPSGLATSVTYNGSSTVPSSAGSYAVVATVTDPNYTGTASGTLVLATATSAPVITVAPTNQSAGVGGSATFSVTASGTPAPTYQWQRNGVALSGQTASTLTLNNLALTDSGASFAVVVTNSAGSVTSGPVTLTVNAVSFSQQFFFGTVGSGGKYGLYLNNQGHVVLIVTLSNGRGSFVVPFNLGSDGSFTTTTNVTTSSAVEPASLGSGPKAAAVTTLTLSGSIVNGQLTGLITTTGDVFNGSAQPTGSTAAIAGYYAAPVLNGGSGTTYLIVGEDGTTIAATTSTAVTEAALGTTTAGGQSSVQFDAQTVFQGLITSAGTLTGQLTAGGTTQSVAGLSSTVTRTDRLVNISTRGLVGSGNSILIGGFVVSGSQPKTVLVRAVGPTLGSYGVSGVLSNPVLQILDSNAHTVGSNTGWSTAWNATQLAAAAAQVGAFTLASGSNDSAVLVTLNPGIYSAQVSGANGGTGIALLEVYDADASPGTETQRLVNISTRGPVTTGAGVMIAGFVVTGNSPKQVLIRGVGPTLASYGVSGALSNPVLNLYQNGTLLTANTGWGSGGNPAAITAAAAQVGAFTLSSGTNDSALLLTLAPGIYSAQVSGANGGTGIALLEVYEVP